MIFPIDYWELIQTHAAAKQLDPFLVAALVAQESTFQADVRSSADAWGLMQIIPATGRRYASAIGIKPFSIGRLTDPETNVRIGTTYFSELLRQFGDAAPALAAYNAGESRVVKWLAERPGMDRDEFIDDIPFPETQNYVKRIRERPRTTAFCTEAESVNPPSLCELRRGRCAEEPRCGIMPGSP